ncbi:MAG: helix-turn-helix transcriptional regulator [Candidatus Heimdallarchaeaceae archaeon]
MDPENRGNDILIHEDEFLDLGAIVPLSQRDALIIEMYEDGLSTYDIATELELNRHTISRVLKENRIETRTIADYHKFKHEEMEILFKEGKTKHEIAKELGLTYYTVRKVLEDKGLILNKKDRESVAIARYIQMKNKGYENEYIAIFLDLSEKQLNKLVRNSGVNVTLVRQRTKDIEVLPEIVLQKLQGMIISDISMKYEIDIVLVREILYEFGLSKKK